MAAMLISAQAVDYDGAVLSGAKLNVYDAGTTTPRAIYASKDLASGASSANPAVATATGGIAVWVDDSAGDIKVTLTNSAGTTTYYQQDGIDPTNGNLNIFPLGGSDQATSTTDDVAFSGLTVGVVAFSGVTADPGADRIMFWDDSDAQVEWLSLGTGLSISGNTFSLDADLEDISGLMPEDGSVIIGNGAGFVTENGATLRTSLGVAIGSNVLAYDANLQAFVNEFTLPTTDGIAGQYLKTNGSGTLAFATPAGGGDLLAAADETVTGDYTFSGDIIYTATGGSTSRTAQDRAADRLTVNDFGAVGDYVERADGAISASGTTFTSASSSFASSDIGKHIAIVGAGAASADLVTTIASINSPTSVEVSDAASTTVSSATWEYCTDDQSAVDAAMTAVATAGGTLRIPKGVYGVSQTVSFTVSAGMQVQCDPGAVIKVLRGFAVDTKVIQPQKSSGDVVEFSWCGGEINGSNLPARVSGAPDLLYVASAYLRGTFSKTRYIANDDRSGTAGDSGLFLAEGGPYLVDSNYFQGFTDLGVYASGDGTGTTGRDLFVTNNVFFECENACAPKRNFRRFIFSGNIMRNCTTGVTSGGEADSVEEGKYVVISNNYAEYAQRPYTLRFADGAVLTGNRAVEPAVNSSDTEVADSGIVLQGAKRCVVSNNTIIKSGTPNASYRAVRLEERSDFEATVQQCEYNLIQGNVIQNAPAGIVELNSSDNNEILDNKFQTVTTPVTLVGSSSVARNFKSGSFVVEAADYTINSLTIGRGLGGVSTNSVVGASALASNTTGAENTAVGASALSANTEGDENTAIGRSSLSANTTGSNNSAVGRAALLANTTGINNVAMGRVALVANIDGAQNVGVGSAALSGVTSGDNNVGIGHAAGDNITTGSNNIVLGYLADASSATATNEVTLGNSSITKVRVPGSAALEVGGQQYLDTAGNATIPLLLGFNAPSTLTISSGVITVTRSHHSVDTEASAGSDDLVTINGGSDGDILILRSVTSSRDVTIKNGTGNIFCGSDRVLNNSTDRIALQNQGGSSWVMISFADNGA